MSDIRTFLMHFSVVQGKESLTDIHELTEEIQLSLADGDAAVFIDVADDKLHSVTIHQGPVTSRYGHVARLFGQTIAVPIGTPIADLVNMSAFRRTFYEGFFAFIHNALQGYPDETGEKWLNAEEFRQAVYNLPDKMAQFAIEESD